MTRFRLRNEIAKSKTSDFAISLRTTSQKVIKPPEIYKAAFTLGRRDRSSDHFNSAPERYIPCTSRPYGIVRKNVMTKDK